MPEQIGRLEITMADPCRMQLVEWPEQLLRLPALRYPLTLLTQMLQQVLAGTVLTDQPGLGPQGAETTFDHGQWLGSGNAEEVQTPGCQPGMPGTTGAPEAFQPMTGTLYVVAFDHQFATAESDTGNSTAAAVLEQWLAGKGAVRVSQQRRQQLLLAAQHADETIEAPTHGKLGAVAQGLVEELLQARLAPAGSRGNDGRRVQPTVARDHVGPQQLAHPLIPFRRQLGKEQPEIVQPCRVRKRPTGIGHLDGIAINDIQLVALLQEVAQMQISLLQPLPVHAADKSESTAQYGLGSGAARVLIGQLVPQLLQAARIRQILGQQIATTAGQLAAGQQGRRAQGCPLQRLDADTFPLPVPLRPGGNEQFGQHRLSVQLAMADQPLARQHPQPAPDPQLPFRQRQGHGLGERASTCALMRLDRHHPLLLLHHTLLHRPDYSP